MFNQVKVIQILLSIIIVQLLLFSIYIFTRNPASKVVASTKHTVKHKKRVLPISHQYSYAVEKRSTQDGVINIKKIAPKSSEDILPIESKKVKPILYTNSIPFASLTIEEKKQKFIDMMIPSILVAKHQLKCDQNRVLNLMCKAKLTKNETEWLAKKRMEFKAEDNNELYIKMEEHPTSIIIAQAIIESGWGTSKFFQKANNVFGVWSFDENDKRVSASKKRGNRTIYLKRYESMEESIYDYLRTLSVGDYKLFREKRLKTKNPYELVNYLIKYSEEGTKYTKSLKQMIKNNKLIVYDSYQLDI